MVLLKSFYHAQTIKIYVNLHPVDKIPQTDEYCKVKYKQCVTNDFCLHIYHPRLRLHQLQEPLILSLLYHELIGNLRPGPICASNESVH